MIRQRTERAAVPAGFRRAAALYGRKAEPSGQKELILGGDGRPEDLLALNADLKAVPLAKAVAYQDSETLDFAKICR